MAEDLTSFNKRVVLVYQGVADSAVQVEGKRKNYHYLRPESILAVMKVMGVPEDKREVVYDRVMMLQGLANDLRRSRPVTKRK